MNDKEIYNKQIMKIKIVIFYVQIFLKYIY